MSAKKQVQSHTLGTPMNDGFKKSRGSAIGNELTGRKKDFCRSFNVLRIHRSGARTV